MSRLRLTLIALTVTLVAAASASANTYTVTETDDPSPISCAPAGSGGCSLREALNAANGAATQNPDEIDLGGQTITLTRTGAPEDANASGDLDIQASGPLTITNGTIVADTGERVLHVRGARVTLLYVTVRGGHAQGSSYDGYGGGMSIDSYSDVEVDQATFAQNTADGGGGAIYGSSDSTLSVGVATFDQNTAQDGGAIEGSSLEITATGSTFTGNTAAYEGGAIVVAGGGGYGSLHVSDSTFRANGAEYGGAINFSTSEDNVVSASTFAGNSATDSGGALYVNDPVTASNITVTGNSVTDPDGHGGGGIYVANTDLHLQHATITHNSADLGPDLFVSGGTTTVANTIVDGACHINNGGTVASLGGNVDTGLTCGFVSSRDQRGQPVRLGPLVHDRYTEVLPLLGGSAGIDAGVPEECAAQDQRGLARLASECDSGAYEAQKIDLHAALSTSPQPTLLGGDVTLTLTASNQGPFATGGVAGTLPLPAGVTFVSGTGAGGAACDAGPPVTCPLGSLGVGESNAANVVVRPSAVGPLSFSAALVGDLAQATPGDDRASAQVDVVAPATVKPDTTKPAVTLALRKGTTLRSIRRTLRLAVRVHVSEAAAVTLRASTRQRKRTRALGGAGKRFAAAGTATLTLRLTKTAARRLMATRRLTLVASAKDAAGNLGSARRSTRLGVR